MPDENWPGDVGESMPVAKKTHPAQATRSALTKRLTGFAVNWTRTCGLAAAVGEVVPADVDVSFNIISVVVLAIDRG